MILSLKLGGCTFFAEIWPKKTLSINENGSKIAIFQGNISSGWLEDPALLFSCVFSIFSVFLRKVDYRNWLLVEPPGHQNMMLSSAIISHQPILDGWNMKIYLKPLGKELPCRNKGTRLRGISTVNGTRTFDQQPYSWPSDTPAPQLPPHSPPPRGFEQYSAGRNPLQCPPGHGEKLTPKDELTKTWGCMYVLVTYNTESHV